MQHTKKALFFFFSYRLFGCSCPGGPQEVPPSLKVPAMNCILSLAARQKEQALCWWIFFADVDRDALHYRTCQEDCDNMSCHSLVMDVYNFLPSGYQGTNKSLGSKNGSMSCPGRLFVVQIILKDNSFKKILKWIK